MSLGCTCVNCCLQKMDAFCKVAFAGWRLPGLVQARPLLPSLAWPRNKEVQSTGLEFVWAGPREPKGSVHRLVLHHYWSIALTYWLSSCSITAQAATAWPQLSKCWFNLLVSRAVIKSTPLACSFIALQRVFVQNQNSVPPPDLA